MHTNTFVIIAQALLGPEGTLTLQVYLVSAEKWRLLELRKDWQDLAVQLLKLFYRSASAVDITFSDLRSALRRVEVARERLHKEVCPVD